MALPPPARLTLGERLTGLAAVAVAWLLLGVTRARPGQLRGLLERLRRGAAPASPAQALRAWEIVTTVSLRAGNSLSCLPRSVAVVCCCRLRYRTRVAWRIGVHSPPFASHAWVEAGGPVGEPVDPRTCYIVILEA